MPPTHRPSGAAQSATFRGAHSGSANANHPEARRADSENAPTRSLGTALRSVARYLLPRAAFVLAAALVFAWLVRFNGSPSREVGYYFHPPILSPPKAGDGVLACAPPEVTRFGLRRGYLTRQRLWGCAPGARPLNKEVVAAGGDTVDLTRKGLFVGGRQVSGPPPEQDREGRPLTPRYGHYVLEESEYWLAADITCSFDSRYFGPVGREGLRARAIPIWTTSPKARPCDD